MADRKVNLVDVNIVDRIGPNYSDLGFKLKFWGKTPGGKDLQVVIDLTSGWGVSEVAMRLHEVQKEHERMISSSRQILEGKV